MNLPAQITEVGDGAFRENYSLKKVELNEGLEKIGSNAFSSTALDMPELKTPSTLRSIGAYAFSGSDSRMKIGKITLNEGLTSMRDGAFRHLYAEEVTLPETLTEIPDYAFQDNNLTSVTLPDQIKKIGNYAFYNNKVLKDVKFPANLEDIRSYAFAYNQIEQIDLPESLKMIGPYAFYSNRLTTLDVPESVTEIDSYAFSNNRLKEIDLKDTLEKLKHYAFADNQLTEVKLPEKITEVAEGLFRNNQLKKVELAPGTTEIQNYAFRDNNLSSMDFKEPLKRIGSSAFLNNELKKVILPDTVEFIGDAAFQNNQIAELKLSENLRELYENVFSNNRLKEVTIPDKVEFIRSSAFRNNLLEKVDTAPTSNLSTISSEAFGGNHLKEVTLPSASVHTIDKNAFKGNPGADQNPGKVSVLLKDETGTPANPVHLTDGTYHTVNKAPLIIKRVLEGDPDQEIAAPLVIMAPIGENYVFTPKDSASYVPVSPDPITIPIQETNAIITIPYKTKDGFNPDAVIIELNHAANGHTADEPYGLKDEYISTRRPLILKVKGSGDIVNIPTPWVTIDLNSPVAGGHIKNVEWPSNISSLASEYKIENGVIKLKLKGNITASYTLEIPFYLNFDRDMTPNNFMLDLSGKTSLLNADETLFTTADKTKKLALRVTNSNPYITKYADGHSSSRTIEYGEADEEGFIKEGTEKIVKYSFSSSSSGTPFIKKLVLEDVLPVYTGKDENGVIKDDLRAHFDPELNPGWELLDDGITVRFTGEFAAIDPTYVPTQYLRLTFPRAKTNTYFPNAVKATYYPAEPEGTVSGNTTEAKEKLKEDPIPYEDAKPHESTSRVNVNFRPVPPNSENKPQDIPTPSIRVYKRNTAFYGDTSGMVIDPDQRNRGRHLEYNYKNVMIDWYSPENYISKPQSYSHYADVFRDNSEDRHSEFLWAIRTEVIATNAEKFVYTDYGLDPRMRFTAIQIPSEFKKGYLKVYSEDNAKGTVLWEGAVYGDRFEIPEDVSAAARSFTLSLDGLIENRKETGTVGFHFRVYTRLRNPDDPCFTAEGADSYGRSEKNKFFNKIAVEAVGFTNDGKLKDIKLSSKDELEHIVVLPWEERVTLQKHLEDANKMREQNDILKYSLDLEVVMPKENTFREFKMVDLLPKHVVPEQVRYVGDFKDNAKNPRYRFEENFEQTGRWAIIIEADEYHPGVTDMSKKKLNIVEIDARTTTDIETQDALYMNEAFMSAKGSTFWDDNTSHLTNLKIYEQDKRVLTASVGFPVLLGSQLKGYKYVKSSTDTFWSNRSTRLLSEQKFEYKLEMYNPTSTPINGLEIYDVLPYNGDLRIVANEQSIYTPRGTELKGLAVGKVEKSDRVRLNGPLTFDAHQKDDYEVFYTTEPVENLKGADPYTVTTNAAIWKTEAEIGGNWADVTAFRVVTKPGIIMAGNSRRQIYVPMIAPENPDYLYDNDIALNSFAYHGLGEPVFVEGNNVEVEMYSPRASLRVQKEYKNPIKPTEIHPLQGAQFKLWAAELAGLDEEADIMELGGYRVLKNPVSYMVNGAPKDTFTTNLNGTILFDELKYNRDYILQEVNVPEGYEIIHEFTRITKEQLKNADDHNLEIHVENKKILKIEPIKPLTGSLEFYKVDQDGEPLSYTGFILEGGPEGPYHVRRFATASETGLVKFTDIPLFGEAYPYTLTETNPRGALQPIEPRRISFKNNGKTEIKVNLGSIKNEKVNLRLYKLGIFSLSEQKKARENPALLTTSAGKALSAVRLILEKENGERIEEFTTDSKGMITIPNLEVETDYYISEPDVPATYKPYENVATGNRLKIRVTRRGEVVINGKKSVNSYAVYPNFPERNTNRVDVTKSGSDGTLLPGVEFGLYKIADDGSEELVMTQKTSPIGQLSFVDFAIRMEGGVPVSEDGTFEIRELGTALGYVNSFKPFRFNTKSDTLAYYYVDAVNNLIKLSVHKTDADTMGDLPHAFFSLYEGPDASGTPLETVESNETGLAEFTYRNFDVTKQYSLKETTLPAGYTEVTQNRIELIDLPSMINQPHFNGTITYEWQNRKVKGSLRVFKISELAEPLEGVEFTLSDPATGAGHENDRVVLTDEKGQAVFADLTFGKSYVLNETKGKPGYVIGDDAKNISITISNEKEVIRTITNKPYPGSLTLYKKDEKGHLLEGAEFTLERKIIGGLYSDAQVKKSGVNGVIEFTALKPGDYRLRETGVSDIARTQEMGAWKGYQKLDTVWIVEVRKGTGTEAVVTVKEQGGTGNLQLPLQIENPRVEPDKVTVNVHKTFDGGTDLNPMPTFKVALFRKKEGGNKEATGDVQLLKPVLGAAAMELKASFENLDYDYYDDTDQKWHKWEYSVEEVIEGDNSDRFTAEVTNGTMSDTVRNFEIKNTFVKETSGTAVATKEWVNGSADHPTVWFKLYRTIAGGAEEAVPGADLKELVSGVTSVTWDNLEKTDDAGHPYTFLVRETDAQGKDWKPESYEKTENGLKVTNTYVAPTDGSAKAVKKWVNGPSDRPTVWFKLYRKVEGGTEEEVPAAEIKTLVSGTTEVLWTGLTKTDDQARPYTFLVKEVNEDGTDLTFVPENYSKTEDGLTVTNTYEPPMTGMATAVKIWKNRQPKYPTIWFKLYRRVGDGEPEEVPLEQAPVKELPDGVTSVTWEDLQATDINGRPYTFLVQEINEKGEDKAPRGYRKKENGLEVENTLIPPGYYEVPNTGHHTNVVQWLSLLGISVALFVVLLQARKHWLEN